MKLWRQQQRQRLLAEREALSTELREHIQRQCLHYIAAYLGQCEPGILGLYWPIKGELDCRQLAGSLLSAGWVLSVPVINSDTRKLDFARWQPDTPMQSGRWNIPVPVMQDLVKPERFLVPLVGFDAKNFRLGYGGGYYDRTLADSYTTVETIGVGMEMGRFETIYPHEMDIPMNKIITESGMQLTATSA